MLLYPDKLVSNQPQNETTCFGGDIDYCDFVYLKARGQQVPETNMHYAILHDEQNGANVFFMRNENVATDRVCVLLRGDEGANKCLESAAWIRVKEEFPGMIYIVRGSTNHHNTIRWHASLMGAAQEYVCMVDLV